MNDRGDEAEPAVERQLQVARKIAERDQEVFKALAGPEEQPAREHVEVRIKAKPSKPISSRQPLQPA